MVQVCPRCHHANPREAIFCHFDGCLLRHDAAGVTGTFLREFVFPSGRRCRTFDELVGGIYYEWEDARGLLSDGTLGGFLAGLGRADLAKAAREAQQQPDVDIALTNFVASLPAQQVQGPKLNLTPRRLVVGPARIGEQRGASLRVTNDGRGILQGKVTVAEGGLWLKVADGDDPASFPVHAPRDQTVALRVLTNNLVVGQNYSGKLVVVTNGGVAEVPVRLDLAAKPFPRVPYQGATTPHELARRMRDQPHPAVPMLESGEIARWFESNGWTYPIGGAPAPGLAAVQQFFEELGLARAPQISISQEEFVLTCRPPDARHEQVVIRSPARKLVYARAESDADWLRVTTPNVSGQVQAAIDFTIDSSRMPEDRLWEGELKVVANAGQTFHVRVRVTVQGNKRGWFGGGTGVPPVRTGGTPVPPKPVTNGPALPPRPRKRAPASLGRVVLVGAVVALAARLALVPIADVYARWLAVPGDAAAGSLEAWLQAPPADEGFLKLVALGTWWVGALVGGLLVWRGGGRWTDVACGVLAGAVAGLAGGATLGCALVIGDAVPRAVLAGLLGGRDLPPVAATPLWVATVLGCWTLMGMGMGLTLGLCGRAGRAALGWLAAPLASAARACRMSEFADELTLE
jgi:hypothetical protein